MTDNEIPVNVIPTEDLRGNLSKVLELFRDGSHGPVVFGDDRRPEAAIIPFADFVRLLHHDQNSLDAEEKFHETVADRVRAGDATRSAGDEQSGVTTDDEFDSWVEDSFGDLGRDWVTQRDARRGSSES